jgi:hypothetical protein
MSHTPKWRQNNRHGPIKSLYSDLRYTVWSTLVRSHQAKPTSYIWQSCLVVFSVPYSLCRGWYVLVLYSRRRPGSLRTSRDQTHRTRPTWFASHHLANESWIIDPSVTSTTSIPTTKKKTKTSLAVQSSSLLCCLREDRSRQKRHPRCSSPLQQFYLPQPHW